MPNDFQVAWWEGEELLYHLSKRPDIWTQDAEDPTSWLRTLDMGGEVESKALLLLQVIPPMSEGRFRQYKVQVVPVDLDEAQAVDYVLKLLRGWSTYGDRLDLQSSFVESFGLSEEQARVAALAAAYTFNVGSLHDKPTFDPDAWANVPLEKAGRELAERTVLGQWELTKGGWLRLTLNKHGFVDTLLSIHGPQHSFGFNVTEFTGVLHPSRSVNDLEESLYGK